MSSLHRLVTLLLCGLATWRISHMVALEAGPFDSFQRLRSRLGVREAPADDGEPLFGEATLPLALRQRTATTPLGKLIACPLCLSVWVSLAVTTAATFSHDPALTGAKSSLGERAVFWLAVSGFSSLAELWGQK